MQPRNCRGFLNFLGSQKSWENSFQQAALPRILTSFFNCRYTCMWSVWFLPTHTFNVSYWLVNNASTNYIYLLGVVCEITLFWATNEVRLGPPSPVCGTQLHSLELSLGMIHPAPKQDCADLLCPTQAWSKQEWLPQGRESEIWSQSFETWLLRPTNSDPKSVILCLTVSGPWEERWKCRALCLDKSVRAPCKLFFLLATDETTKRKKNSMKTFLGPLFALA